jgi:asparagine synthetase B (glutamine-hydrolysing)
MILGVLGGGPGDTDAWLAHLGAKWVGRGAGASAWLAHTGSPSESHFAQGDLLVVADSRLAHCGAASDADVIARAYLADGLDSVRGLSGRFAFLLYDARSHLFVGTSGLTSRRPVAYWSRGDTVVAGSRVLPLLRHPRAPRAVMDERYLAHLVLGYGAAPAGTTPIRDVRRLPAGVALIARAGTVREDRIDSLSPTELPLRMGEIEAFWGALESAVERPARAHGRPCLALSGGLDSAAVAAAAIRRAPSFAAFSMVAPQLALDGRQSIDALEGVWPGVRLRRVECSAARAYPDLARFSLRDDPPLLPLSLLPARLHLWSAVREAGFDTVLDGEGGDELFGGCVTPLDAFRRGHWLTLLRHLRARPNRRSLVLRSLVLPLMPSIARRPWIRRWSRPGAQLPAYLEPAATERPIFEEATAQFYGRRIHRPALELVEDWLSWPTGIGSVAAHEGLAREFGLELTSPLLDREVIQLVLGLRPSSLLSRGLDKHFLREALAGRIPEAVRTQPKDVRLADALGCAIVTSPEARLVLRDRQARERFAGWIRFEKLDALLDAMEVGYRPGEWLYWQLECALTLCEWYPRASREYGVE